MTTETMNIHQALVELKALDKRIESAIKDGEWVVANKHTNTKIGGVDLKEYVVVGSSTRLGGSKFYEANNERWINIWR